MILAAFLAWLFLISLATFAFWMKPLPSHVDSANNWLVEAHYLLRSFLAMLFFLSFFALGCWISVLNVKGLS